MAELIPLYDEKYELGLPPQESDWIRFTSEEQAIIKKVKAEAEFPAEGVDLITVTLWLQGFIKDNKQLEREKSINPAIQNAKAALAEAVSRHLQAQHEVIEEPKAKKPSFWRRFGWPLYFILSGAWVLRDGFNVIMGVADIFPMLLKSVNLFRLLSTGLMLLTAGLLWFLELRYFKNSLPIHSVDEGNALIAADGRLMEATTSLNKKMKTYSLYLFKLPKKRHEQFATFTGLLNQDAPTHRYQKFEEKPWLKAAWFGVQVLGVLVGCFSDYFSWYSILGFLAPALVGTPVGWGLLIGGLVISVAIYSFLYSRNNLRSLTPVVQQFEKTKELADQFDRHNKNDFMLPRENHEISKIVGKDDCDMDHSIRKRQKEYNLNECIHARAKLGPLEVEDLNNQDKKIVKYMNNPKLNYRFFSPKKVNEAPFEEKHDEVGGKYRARIMRCFGR